MTDYSDFPRSFGTGVGSNAAGTRPGSAAKPNSISVGIRSDGQIMITSAPTDTSTTASSFIMPPDTAKWMAEQVLHLLRGSEPSSDPQAKGNGE